MSDYLAERLKAHAAEQQRQKQLETEPRPLEQQSLQKRGEAFVAANARSEYENLKRLLKERAEAIRSEIGNLREIVITESHIQIGHFALYHHFDQLIPNEPKNELVLSVGLAPHKSFMFGNPPQPVIHKLIAAAAPDCNRIVWVGVVGRLGQFDSDTLAVDALDMLVRYYINHTRR